MIEGSDGQYYFQAGAICLAGFWRMEDKLGMSLENIHLSGNVPKCWYLYLIFYIFILMTNELQTERNYSTA